MIDLVSYLGRSLADLRSETEIGGWPCETTVERELPNKRVHYTFHAHGLEVMCDEDDLIETLFAYSRKFEGFDQSLIVYDFSWNRSTVRERFGEPSRKGERKHDELLGEMGAWDRFDFEDWSLHFQYQLDETGIVLITIMKKSAVPN